MLTKSTPSTPAGGYLHSHVWFIVSVVVVLMAALIISFFLFRTKSLTNWLADKDDQFSTSQATDGTAPVAAETVVASVSPSPEASATAVEISTDASAATVTSEINSIDVAAIQADLEELQATLAGFSSLTE